jgi:6-phosphogluconate dehydrogenase
LRLVVCQTDALGVPVLGLICSLGYLDCYRNSWLPANLIQGKRDYLGMQTYECIDAKGTFHTEWENK